MELYVPSAVVWFFIGCAWMFVVGVVAFAALVFLAMRAKARREREPEPEIKDILYVDSAGSDANDGRSTETAMATLGHALDIKTENDCIMVFCGSDEEMTVGESKEE